MGSNTPFEKQPSEFEQSETSPQIRELDASLRHLADETHPKPAFVARLRGDLEQKTAASPHRLNFTWTRPLFAQAALVLLLVGLVALALGLTPHLQAGTKYRQAGTTFLPGIQDVTGTPSPDATMPTAMQMQGRLGKGKMAALDSTKDNLLAVASTTGVCVYNQAVQEEWCAWTYDSVSAAVFNPGGNLLAVGLGRGRVQILDARTGLVLAERPSSSMSSITGLAWDPAGAPVIASVNIIGTLEAWDWQSDTLRWQPQNLPSTAAALDWAQGSGGESLLAAGGDNGLVLLDGETGLEKARYEPTWQVSPVLGISSLAFSSAGSTAPWLVYAYRGGVAALKLDGWQVRDTRNWLLDATGDPVIISLALSLQTGEGAGSLRLAAAGPEGIQIIRVEDGTVGEPVAPPTWPGAPLVWTTGDAPQTGDAGLFFAAPDGMLARIPADGSQVSVARSEYTTFLVDMTWDQSGPVATNGINQVRAWRADLSQADVSNLALPADAESLTLSPDGELVACVLKNGGTVVMWDRISGQPAWTVELSSQENLVAFSQDGSRLAIATRDGRITAYDRLTGQVTGEVSAPLPQTKYTAIAWAPSSYGYDALAAAWTMEDGSGSSGIQLASLDGRLDWSTKQLVENITPVYELAWAPGGPESDGLLAGFQSEQVGAWDAETGAEVFRIGENTQMASIFHPTLAFSHSGSLLAFTSRAGITVWDLPSRQVLQFFSGQDNIRRLAFSADDNSLASASLDGAITLRDLATSVQPTPTPILPTPTPLPPEPEITPTAITPDPTRDAPLARLGSGTISALDAAPDGRLAVGTTAGVCLHDPGMAVNWCRWLGSVSRVAFNPAGETLAVALAQSTMAQDIPLLILDASDGRTLAQRNFKFSDASTMPGSAQLAWDPLGAPKIAIAETGGLLSVWDWPADQITWGAIELSGPVGYDNQGYISALDWSSGPNGESLLAVGSSLGLSLIDGATGELKQRYDSNWELAPVDPILALAFAPHDGAGGPGRHLAYVSDEDLIVLEMQGWNATGASAFDILLQRDVNASSLITRMDWAPSTGDLLSMRLALTYAADLWIYEPFKEHVPPQFVTACHSCAMTWTADGTGLFLQEFSGMLSKYTDETLAPYPLDYSFVPEALVWPASNDLYSFNDYTTNRWDVTNTRLGAVGLVYESQLHALMAVSPEGQNAAYLLPAQDDLLLWSSTNNQRITLIDASPGPTSGLFGAAAFSADGSRIATASTTGALALWHVPSGQPIRGGSPLEGASQIDALALSPDGDIAAVAWTDDHSPHITLYSFIRGATVAHIPTQNTITALAWSPDGRLIGAAGGYSAMLINTASGDVLHTLGPEIDPAASGTDQFEPGVFYSLAFSPDGSTLATGGNHVTLWDTGSGTLRKTFSGHTTRVIALAFRPGGDILASASTDGVIQLWDLGAGPLPPPEEAPTPTPLP